MKVVMMVFTCPHCQQPSSLMFQVPDINQKIVRDSFSYYRCDVCGLIFLRPIPENIDQFYRQEYYAIPQSAAELAIAAHAQYHKIETVRQFMPGGRLLEIGSSYGDFAYLAKEAGYQVDAIEMDAECCRFLQSALGIKAVNSHSPLEALDSLGVYDVVALWQVIEHLPNPWVLLEAISAHLASKGILVLSAPNPSAFQFRLFGKRWAHVDAPRHLQLVPIPLLLEWAAKVGLKPVLVTTNDRESLKANIFGWKKSLMNVLGVSASSGPAGDKATINLKPSKSWVYRMVRGLLRAAIFVIRWVVSPLERTGHRGSSYTVVFQKSGQRADGDAA